MERQQAGIAFLLTSIGLGCLWAMKTGIDFFGGTSTPAAPIATTSPGGNDVLINPVAPISPVSANVTLQRPLISNPLVVTPETSVLPGHSQSQLNSLLQPTGNNTTQSQAGIWYNPNSVIAPVIAAITPAQQQAFLNAIATPQAAALNQRPTVTQAQNQLAAGGISNAQANIDYATLSKYYGGM